MAVAYFLPLHSFPSIPSPLLPPIPIHHIGKCKQCKHVGRAIALLAHLQDGNSKRWTLFYSIHHHLSPPTSLRLCLTALLRILPNLPADIGFVAAASLGTDGDERVAA
ncbi:hypothetical protein CVT26_004023 [Gymnopilus dilepis]|uniref:Uncharacterized protein n=1 Tax=Gymnopilus dilepis TaxID=231916 RepID=A0A409X1J1_9AGAR|nr:hypothetical protein CVT26_004023 [Gymnopilus dilepis]